MNLPCSMGHAADGSVRCITNTPVTSTTSRFGDPGCQTPVASSPAACPRVPVVLKGAVGCPSRIVVRRGGDRLQPTYGKTVVLGSGDGGVSNECRASPESGYPIGDELPPSSFPPGTDTLLPGPGRLHQRLYTTSVGSQRTPRALDDKLGVDCSAVRAEDDRMRCLPADAAGISGYFADAGCQVALAYTSTGACFVPYARSPERAVCRPRNTIFKLGPKHGGPAYQVKAGVCTEIVPATGFDYYPVGERVPAETFVELVEVVR
jgi:hypothetical protein